MQQKYCRKVSAEIQHVAITNSLTDAADHNKTITSKKTTSTLNTAKPAAVSNKTSIWANPKSPQLVNNLSRTPLKYFRLQETELHRYNSFQFV